MANFRVNEEFSPIGLALLGNRGKRPEVRFQLSLLCLRLNSFLLEIYVLATSKVKITGFEPHNYCHIYRDSLVFCLMLIGKYKKIAEIREIAEIFHP